MWERSPGTNNLSFVSLVLLMTLLGALASYSYQVLAGEKFRWQVLLLQAFVSIFAGALVLMAATYYGWAPEVAGGISGLAGWSGAGFIKVVERVFLKQIGGPSDHE